MPASGTPSFSPVNAMGRTPRAIFFLLLDVDIQSHAEHLVGSGEVVGIFGLDRLPGGCIVLRVAFVECLVVGSEVGDVDFHFL